jgi:hypothetical protein
MSFSHINVGFVKRLGKAWKGQERVALAWIVLD